MTLCELLTMKGIPGIQGIDTRKLTRLLRDKGALKGILTAAGEEVNVQETVAHVASYNYPTDLVARVSTQKPYPSPGRGERIILIDYGMKHGILRELNDRDCDVIVVPYNTTTKEILSLSPDGIVLSNGPGNPMDVEGSVEVIMDVVGSSAISNAGSKISAIAIMIRWR